jgi:hypothetical protein
LFLEQYFGPRAPGQVMAILGMGEHRVIDAV